MNLFFFDSEKNFGGVERWMLNVARYMTENGHTCFFSGREHALFLQRSREEGYRTFPMAVSSDFSIINIFKLARIFRTFNIDIVITNLNKDTRLCGMAKQFSRRTRLIGRHGLPILPNNLIYKHTFCKLADGIITPSTNIKDTYMTYGWVPDRFIRVIHNGISDVEKNVTSNDEIRKQHNISEKSPIIGNFGRLVPQKQQHLFLTIGARLLKDWPEAQLMIVGDGPQLEALGSMAFSLGISDRVSFMGFQKMVQPLYAISDIMVHTSMHEGLPNVVLEAMNAGKPVVAFNVGGIRELIPDDSYGLVVPLDDIEAMIGRINSLMQSPSMRERIGRNARDRIKAEFSLEKMLRDVELYFLEIARTGGVPELKILRD